MSGTGVGMFDNYDQHGCLQHLFEQAVGRIPNPADSNAVVDPGNSKALSFAELLRQSSAIAQYLIQERHAERNKIVGIFMDKSCEYVASYVGALKAGCAYLPLDLASPDSMIRMTVEEAKPIAILTKTKYVKRLAGIEHLIVSLDGLPSKPLPSDENETVTHPAVKSGSDVSTILTSASDYAQNFQPPACFLDDLAYVVYSSGTTGKPKGILCPHRGAVFSYLYRHKVAPFEQPAEERVACNIFFVWELLIPILRGVPTYIVPDTTIADPPLLCRYIQEHRITRILFTPSLLETILETCPKNVIDESLRTLRIIWLNGEVVTEKLQQRAVEALPWIKLMNLYSISECHDVALCNLTQDWNTRGKYASGVTTTKSEPQATYGNQTIARTGDILPGVVVFILDADMKPVPKGVPGQIYVAGPTLARGYFNRELTEKRFIQIPDALRPLAGDKPLYDGRMYFTGDWGFIRVADRGLQICGRCDTMVKIRGYSIEIQAVEVCLQNSGLVQACAVVVHGREGEDKRLVAYILPSATLVKAVDSPKDTVTMKKEVRAYMKKMLPFYMIPAQFIFVRDMPTSDRSGKLDKTKLPDPDQVLKSESAASGANRKTLTEQNSVERGMPSDADEQLIATIWSEVLGTTYIDVHENFFDLGGHSLTAVRMLAKLNKAFHVDIIIDELFENATVSELAELVQIKRGGNRAQIAAAGDAEISSRERRQSVSRRRESRHTSGALKLNLLKEVEKHDSIRIDADIQLRAFWRSLRMPERWIRCQVLLTGATGYLGAHILADLLLRTKTMIYCLVKEHHGSLPIKERLRQTLISYGLLLADDDAESNDAGDADESDEESYAEKRKSRQQKLKQNAAVERDRTPTRQQQTSAANGNNRTDNAAAERTAQLRRLARAFNERVTAVRGDVSLNNLGMNDEDYVALSTDVDCVIHCAAYVNLLYPYVAMHGPNVQGTANVLQFATMNKIKALHYVSTNGVFPYNVSGLKTEFDETPRQLDAYRDKLADGYSQSKWVAEQLVWRAIERGLPAVIYRPGNLGPSLATGKCNVSDFNVLFLRTCIALNSVPALDADTSTIEWTPVDFVSSMIVHLALLAPSAASFAAATANRIVQPDATHLYGKAFNAVNAQRISLEQVHSALLECGYADVKLVRSWSEWLKLLEQYLAASGRRRSSSAPGNSSSESNSTVQAVQTLANLVMPTTMAGRLRSTSTSSDKVSISEADDETFSAGAAADLLPKMFTAGTAKFSTTNTQSLYLQPNCLEYPPLNAAVMKQNLRSLQRLKLIDLPTPIFHPSNAAVELSALFDSCNVTTLRGRLAIVTGASSGIGRATAIMLAKCGAFVGAVARRAERLEEISAEIGGNGLILPLQADVCDREALVDAVRRAEEHFGCRVRILVNCAGVMYYTYMKNMLIDQWHQQIDVNCKGAVNAVYAVLPSLLSTENGKKSGGHIVNISSDAGRRGFAGLAVYSGTKFFIEGWSQAMRHELKQHDVRITCIQPGDVKTELLLKTTDEEARQDCDGSSTTEIMRPDDIARTIVFALLQPNNVAMNEILIEPIQAPI